MKLKNIVETGEPELLATGFQFTEGPIWMPEGYLLFSDIPANKIYKWTPEQGAEVWRDPSGNSNGLTRNLNNQLLACEHGNRRVSLTNANGTVETLVDRFEGKKLNSPNDLVMKSDDEVCAGVHGILLNDVVSNYYKDRTIFHFKKSLSSDSFVHLLGTGTLCFNTKNIAVSLDWMNYKELSDIVVAMELEKKGKRRVCAARPAAWLTPFKEDSPANTLYRRGLRDPGEATDLINSIKWSSVS